MADEPLTASVESIRRVIAVAGDGLVERETLVELLLLAAVASEHVLVIGPPGTAKSAAARRVATALGGRYFEYLLGRFTEPNEIFGPVNLARLREGVVETETSDMLPEAEVAFLDEVFLGSTAILNTLLSLLNERTFRRGHTRIKCPLRVCVGASNTIPEEPSLAAFADRFLVHAFVRPLPDSALETLISRGRSLDLGSIDAVSNMTHLDALLAAARRVDLSGVQPAYAHAVRVLRRSGIELHDRRIVKAQSLVAAAAVLAGRDRATGADLWPIVYAIPSAAGQDLAREVLHDVLHDASNPALASAAEEAAASRAARAQRIEKLGTELFKETSSDRADWLLRVEALAREIDAAFPPGQLPANLQPIRQQIVEALKA